MWLRDPGDAIKWHDIAFHPVQALGGEVAPTPIPVSADSCTMAFLQSKSVTYRGRLRKDDDGVERPIIHSLIVRPVADGQPPPVTLPFEEFLRNMLAERRKTVCAEDDNDLPRIEELRIQIEGIE